MLLFLRFYLEQELVYLSLIDTSLIREAKMYACGIQEKYVEFCIWMPFGHTEKYVQLHLFIVRWQVYLRKWNHTCKYITDINPPPSKYSVAPDSWRNMSTSPSWWKDGKLLLLCQFPPVTSSSRSSLWKLRRNAKVLWFRCISRVIN